MTDSSTKNSANAKTHSPSIPRSRLWFCVLALLVLVAAVRGYPTSSPPASHPGVALAQEADSVVAVALSLFEAMRTSNGEMAASVFHTDARLGRATEQGISFNGVENFVERIGAPKEVVWDEPIWDWVVNVDGRLAQMWTKYAFYVDDEFSHCGTDAFEFYKGESGWVITQLVDTSRREDCWYPPER